MKMQNSLRAVFGLVLVAMLFDDLRAGVPDQVLIDFDSTWRYHDGDRDLGIAWRLPEFNDNHWESGPGLLGYDTRDRRGSWPDPGLQTEVQPGLITYYFRTEFDFDAHGLDTQAVRLQMDQIIDDAAVYYLNGTEIGRSELMGPGEVRFGTRATAVTNPSLDRDVFEIDASLLRHGRNVLAASVHNAAPTSSDICFGVRLTASEATTPPYALYLSWQQDPTTTMTVQWITEPEHRVREVEYWGGDGQRQLATPSTVPMVFSDRTVHTVELTGLEPDTEYRFRLRSSELGQSSPQYLLRTMPSDTKRPLRIAIGGDIRHRKEWMEQTNRQAVRFDPDFIVWGGDLAYADGLEQNMARWDEFFSACMNTLITESGRVVPVVMAIGNHEVQGGYYWGNERTREGYRDRDEFRNAIAPYFYNLFAFPGHPGYGVLDFGDYLSLIILDTDHSGPVEGAQTDWLRERLAERNSVTHVIPIYHVPAYPSVRRYDGGTSSRVREHWSPLFDQHGVRVAFEHHDHAYKRTVPIRAEQPDDAGTVYVGDGAWGVGPREVHDSAETWYLERAESVRHFILLTIAGEHLDMKAINESGNLIDHFISGPSGQVIRDDSPEDVVRRFSAAVLDLDFETALKLMVPDSKAASEVREGGRTASGLDNPNLPADVDRMIRLMLTRGWEYAAIGGSGIDGESASVTIRRPDREDIEIELIREDGRWMIAGPADIVMLR